MPIRIPPRPGVPGTATMSSARRHEASAINGRLRPGRWMTTTSDEEKHRIVSPVWTRIALPGSRGGVDGFFFRGMLDI